MSVTTEGNIKSFTPTYLPTHLPTYLPASLPPYLQPRHLRIPRGKVLGMLRPHPCCCAVGPSKDDGDGDGPSRHVELLGA
jgi:hypothetical protein